MEGINAMLEICFPKDAGIPYILRRKHEWKRHWISLQIGETETESQGGKVGWIRDLSRIRVSSSPSALFRLLAIDVNILGTFLLQETRIPLVHTCAGVTKTNEAACRMNCRNRVNNFPTVDGGAIQRRVVQMNEVLDGVRRAVWGSWHDTN